MGDETTTEDVAEEVDVGAAIFNLYQNVPVAAPGDDGAVATDDSGYPGGPTQGDLMPPGMTYGGGSTEDCPPGYLCEGFVEVSCQELRDKYVELGFGDVHAGAYCPGTAAENRSKIVYENCELGYYCPNSTTKIECPAGYFCPHKTATPEIICTNCPVASKEFRRNYFGYYIICFACAMIIIILLNIAYKRRKAANLKNLEELQKHRAGSKEKQQKKEREERLRRLRPKLEKIKKRLTEHVAIKVQEAEEREERERKLSASSHHRTSGSTRKRGSDRRGNQDNVAGLKMSAVDYRKTMAETIGTLLTDFDPDKIFDAIDEDESGDLTYGELNNILDLDAFQLREFIRRMNHLASLPDDTDSVTKDVFNKFFLQVLELSSHFAPTEDEVADLYEKIAEKQGVDPQGDVKYKYFYDSMLTEFLSDSQINDLIKRFKRVRFASTEQAPKSSMPNIPLRPGLTKQSSAGRFEKGRFTMKRSTGSQASLTGIGGGRGGKADDKKWISRADFIEHYPSLLLDVLGNKPGVDFNLDDDDASVMGEAGGVDLTFTNLCLAVKVGNSSVNVVDNVTGRLETGTMTALMGGSGAGKTSLLNALCGRAYYGEVTGTIKINGHQATIEEHKSAVGFVPQDDIVYAELTVRENFMFAGQFALPRGTPKDEIVDLADSTMASLGLSKVAGTIVGDVTRRGVSGGEKKRVNIGLELMAKPSILFLDEPTSGLDSSSALLVMQSLRRLVEMNGVTVCSVIHQPRKIIFELFDSIILLGDGGKVVYHGRVDETVKYFSKIHYELPEGESVADWLIDVSAGRTAALTKQEQKKRKEKKKRESLVSFGTEFELDRKLKRQNSNKSTGSVSSVDSDGSHEDFFMDNNATAVGIDGLSAQQFAKANEIAKLRRDKLFKRWQKHFKRLPKKKKVAYMAPKPYALPRKRKKTTFLQQLIIHLRRQWIVGVRNAGAKMIDLTVVVAAVIVISLLDSIVEPTIEVELDVDLEQMISETEPPVRELFRFAVDATKGLIEYGLKVGVVVAVLVGLTATKILTEKRLEFFREAGNGQSINAYFLAVNIVATLEQSFTCLVASIFALWLRNTITDNGDSFLINFLVLSWVCVSWALLFPLIVPSRNVVLVTGFFMTFFALLFSGGISPVLYRDLYDDNNMFLAIFCGFLSPTRFFIESLTISESRCLPTQTGFTDLGPEAPDQVYAVSQIGIALNDFDNVTTRSCKGWYWGILPSLLVGLTVRAIAAGALHFSHRGKQGKKPLMQQIKAQLLQGQPRLLLLLLSYLFLVLCLMLITSVTIVFEY